MARYDGSANLKPWKPGESGNPSGKPKQPLSDAIRRLLNRPFSGKSKKIRLHGRSTIADGVARAAVESALAGDISATREIGDRVEGRPAQRIELSGTEGGAPIQINTPDLSKLSKEELLQYRTILAKAARRDDRGD